MSITFRKISISDADFISTLRNSVSKKFLHTSNTYSTEEVREWIRTKDPKWYIIENESVDIGYFRCSDINLDQKSMYVGADILEEYRGLGLGYQSYQSFISFIHSQGFNSLKLEVLSTNKRAFNLYKKLGFEITKIEQQSIVKDSQKIDNIFMELKINK